MIYKGIFHVRNLFAAAFFLVAFLPFMANAQQDLERYSEITARASAQNVVDGETITIATEINMADHWHVYWKNPGDSGLPVQIEWDLPAGFEIGDIQCY